FRSLLAFAIIAVTSADPANSLAGGGGVGAAGCCATAADETSVKIVQNRCARIECLLEAVIVQNSGDNRAMPTSTLRVIVCSVASALVLAVSNAPLSAQPPSASRIAAEPDVQGAERLFGGWLEGQLLERGLPGSAG